MNDPVWIKTGEEQWVEYYLRVYPFTKYIRNTHDGRWWMVNLVLATNEWEVIPNATTFEEAAAYALAIWRIE